MNNFVNFIASGNLVSVYSNKNEKDKFSVGFVKSVSDSEDFLLMESVSPDGEYDGYLLIKIGDIYKMDHGTPYEDKILKLYKFKNKQHVNFNFPKLGLMHNILELCLKENFFVSFLMINDEEFSGKLVNFNDNFAEMEVYDFFDGPLGKKGIELSKIKKMTFNSKEDVNLKILYE